MWEALAKLFGSKEPGPVVAALVLLILSVVLLTLLPTLGKMADPRFQWVGAGLSVTLALVGVVILMTTFFNAGAGDPSREDDDGESPTRRFQRLENATWDAFFQRAADRVSSSGKDLRVDMVAHSLWSHFRPARWTPGRHLHDLKDEIRGLEIDACLWDRLLRPWLQDRNHSCTLRVIIIKPHGYQSGLVSHQQRDANEADRDKDRQASEDGIRTLYVLNELQSSSQYEFDITARILKEEDMTMTYSLCRVEDLVLVGHYSYKLLSQGVPCSVFDKSRDDSGHQFWDDIHRLFGDGKDGEHSIHVPLRKAPPKATYEVFRDWVLALK